MEKDLEKYYATNRTEEVQDIIDRMPTKFGFWVTVIVLSLFILLFVFGWLIRYPDVVTGNITVNANEAPVKLFANTYGKLKLNGLKSMQDVKEGQVIGYLQNAGDINNILRLDSMLKHFNPNEGGNLSVILSTMPRSHSFGEINSKYAVFLNSLNELNNYNVDQLFEKQVQNLTGLLAEQNKAISTSENRIVMSSENLAYISKFYKRDSTLFSKKVISESELDKTQMSYLSNKDAYQNAMGALINHKQNAQQTAGKIKEVAIQQAEKLKELRIAVIATYNDLIDNIKAWEQKYVFRVPFDGKIQYLKFWVNNQFVQSGEPVFTVIPKMGKPIGQASIPAFGVGKVTIGQEVIVKLENYPYTEYGTVKGTVNSISLATNTAKTDKGDVKHYLVTVNFPNNLRTNYGAVLNANLETKGTAEIITKDRRLIERFFDNLKYATKK